MPAVEVQRGQSSTKHSYSSLEVTKITNLVLLPHVSAEFGHHQGVRIECEDEITRVLCGISISLLHS